MRILVVSGFLGAGKTTFIQELARRTGRDFVVYENEYGQTDIDARALAQVGDLSVWESTENCICCSGKQDFATSVLTIANTLDPECLVVEPTGVAKLSAIMENIGLVSYERVSLLPSLTVVDALAWVRQRERFADIYLDQIASAARVVVSKAQLASPGEVSALVSWIAEKNSRAQIVSRPWAELEDSWLASLLEPLAGEAGAAGAFDLPGAPALSSASARGGSPTPATAISARCGSSTRSEGMRLSGGSSTRSEGMRLSGALTDAGGFDSLTLTGASLPSEGHLLWFLDALVAGVFGEVVRAKGALPCGGQWLRFDVVDRMWQVTGAEGMGLGAVNGSAAEGEPPSEADGWTGALSTGGASSTGMPPSAGAVSAEAPPVVFIGPSIRRSWLREVLVPLVRDAYAAKGAAAFTPPAQR